MTVGDMESDVETIIGQVGPTPARAEGPVNVATPAASVPPCTTTNVQDTFLRLRSVIVITVVS